MFIMVVFSSLYAIVQCMVFCCCGLSVPHLVTMCKKRHHTHKHQAKMSVNSFFFCFLHEWRFTSNMKHCIWQFAGLWYGAQKQCELSLSRSPRCGCVLTMFAHTLLRVTHSALSVYMQFSKIYLLADVQLCLHSATLNRPQIKTKRTAYVCILFIGWSQAM